LMEMLPALSWVEGAGIFAATRQPTTQAMDRCHALPRGRKLSWGPKWSLPFFL